MMFSRDRTGQDRLPFRKEQGEAGLMPPRAKMALSLLLLGMLALGLEGLHAALVRGGRQARLDRMAALARALELTDPALFTEARYVRHLSQADLFTPFQDAPVSLEHFPSGALVLPPAHLGRHGGGIMSGPADKGGWRP